MDSLFLMNFLQEGLRIFVGTLFTSTVIGVFINHLFDKKIRTHEARIEKYFHLIEEFAKFVGSEPDWNKLRPLLNEALLFASDEVGVEILKFSNKYEELRLDGKGGNFQISAQEIKPLVFAIREDLYLKSKKMSNEKLVFFYKILE